MAVTLGSVACVDPLALKLSCDAAGLPTDRWWGKANSFTLTPGEEPGRGWVLFRKAALDALTTSSYLTMTFVGTTAANQITFTGLTLVSYECVSPGAPNDPDATYLLELADLRHLFRLSPFAAGYRAYNVRTADGGAYQTATLNSGSPWTWQQVVTDLGVLAGTGDLTLPFTPNGTPENLIYSGSAWAALNDVLTRLGCVWCFGTDNTFAVVRLGAAGDDPLLALEDSSEFLGRTWDGYSGEAVRAWRPEKVRVRFLRRPTPDWTGGATPYYTVDVTLTSAVGVLAGTVVQLDDDLTALGATGTPSNASALATRAAERADDWLRKRGSADRPVLRAWADIQPKAVTAVGRSVSSVTFDDRGGEVRTWAQAMPDRALEKWRPLGDYPPWWPFTTGGSTVSVWKSPAVRARTTGALPSCTYANGTSGVGATLTGTSNGALAAQDGVTLTVNQDLLVANQASQSQNGIYTVTQVGTGGTPFILTRRTDADESAELLGAVVTVTEGATYADTVWLCTADATITVGTTALPWVQVGASGVTVQEADLSPSYTGATTLRFDQADGFVVSQPSAGVARVDLQAATTTQTGVVSTVAQTVGGLKTFADGLAVSFTSGKSILSGGMRINGYFEAPTNVPNLQKPWVGPQSFSLSSLGPLGCIGFTLTNILSPDLYYARVFALGGGNNPGVTSYVYASDVWVLTGEYKSIAATTMEAGRLVVVGRYAVHDTTTLYTGKTVNQTITDGFGVVKTMVFVGGILVDVV